MEKNEIIKHNSYTITFLKDRCYPIFREYIMIIDYKWQLSYY